MVIRSRVKPERRVEGDGHSLAVVACHGCGCNRFEVQPQPSESIMGLIKECNEFKSPYYVMDYFK